jgi:hypothetical protein
MFLSFVLAQFFFLPSRDFARDRRVVAHMSVRGYQASIEDKAGKSKVII